MFLWFVAHIWNRKNSKFQLEVNENRNVIIFPNHIHRFPGFSPWIAWLQTSGPDDLRVLFQPCESVISVIFFSQAPWGGP